MIGTVLHLGHVTFSTITTNNGTLQGSVPSLFLFNLNTISALWMTLPYLVIKMVHGHYLHISVSKTKNLVINISITYCRCYQQRLLVICKPYVAPISTSSWHHQHNQLQWSPCFITPDKNKLSQISNSNIGLLIQNSTVKTSSLSTNHSTFVIYSVLGCSVYYVCIGMWCCADCGIKFKMQQLPVKFVLQKTIHISSIKTFSGRMSIISTVWMNVKNQILRLSVVC